MASQLPPEGRLLGRVRGRYGLILPDRMDGLALLYGVYMPYAMCPIWCVNAIICPVSGVYAVCSL